MTITTANGTPARTATGLPDGAGTAALALDTPLGPLAVLTDGGSVLASGFTAHAADLLALVHPSLRASVRPAGGGTREAIRAAVAAYFAGDPSGVAAVPVRQHSDGAFLDHAWRTLRDVPAGEPVTYTAFAALAGRPAAVRAAAGACARNAAALFVPCHRVIRTDGTLGGYRWGIDRKQWLLAHEARFLINRVS